MLFFYYGNRGRERKKRNWPADRTAHTESVADYTVFSPTRALRLRVSVHCRWARKPKSATLRAKECERNRTDGRFRLALSRNKHRLLPQAFRSYSFNRGAADLDGFAIANERDLNAHGSEWRKRRIIGRIVWTVGRSVRFRSLPLISAPSVVKGTTRDDPTTKNSEKPIYGRGQKAFTHAARLLV